MDDYIDRQAAIDAIQKLVDKYVDRLDINRVPSMMAVQFGKAEDAKWSAAANSAEKALNIVKAISSADVEPVRHAKRIVICHEENSYSYACEACGIPVDICDNFCRGCGAKLDGGL